MTYSNKDIFSRDYLAADAGAYFTSWQAATANTAVATTTQALGTTSPTIVIFNGAAAGGPNMYMKSVKVEITAATTGLTTVEHVGVLNSGSPHTTVGTLMSSPVNVNGASSNGSLALLYGGVNIMATPAASARIVHTGTVDNSIPIVLDTWTLVYGEDASNTNKIGTMTLVKNITVPIGPVIIPPRTYYSLGFWGASWAASAPTYRLTVGWIERTTGQTS
jgi:hypothetical protein